MLIDSGLIDDATKIWWAVRAHARFPTIEMRITDICTRRDDGITVAALSACLLSMLWRLRCSNHPWPVYATMLVRDNRWLAPCYGFGHGLVDFGKHAVVPDRS